MEKYRRSFGLLMFLLIERESFLSTAINEARKKDAQTVAGPCSTRPSQCGTWMALTTADFEKREA